MSFFYKFIIILVQIYYIYGIDDYDLILKGQDFYVDFDYSNIVLKSNCNKRDVIINYETLSEKDIYKKISFGYFATDLNNNVEYVRQIHSSNYVYMELMNEINHTNKYTNNKMDVYLFTKRWNFTNMDNNLVLHFSVNHPVNYDGKYLLQISDYNIVFSEFCESDYIKKKVLIERFGNNFYIHFPAYKAAIYYYFSIIYDVYYYND